MQAVLILAHKNAEQVYKLAEFLSKRFYVYIHFDAKYNIPQNFLDLFNNSEKVFLIERMNVNWGGYSIVSATQMLFRDVLKNDFIDYVHVISGQDWPVVDVDMIYDFFDKNAKIYMNYQEAYNIRKSFEKIIWWQKFYFDYDNSFVSRKSLLGKVYHRIMILLQMIVGVDKFKKLNIALQIYSGSQWVSMPRYAIQYCVDFIEQNPNYEEMFKSGFCSDEFWMQTILCNSQYRTNIVNNNFRYINWTKKYSNYPGILDEDDYKNIKLGTYFFARKIDFSISEKLLKKLNLWVR